MMNVHEVENFTRLFPLMESAYEEIGAVSRNNPAQVLNSFKMRFVNELLIRANTILEDEYRPFPEFIKFTEDMTPNMSDILFILAEYLSALETMKTEHIQKEKEYPHEWFWIINGKISEKTTAPMTN